MFKKYILNIKLWLLDDEPQLVFGCHEDMEKSLQKIFDKERNYQFLKLLICLSSLILSLCILLWGIPIQKLTLQLLNEKENIGKIIALGFSLVMISIEGIEVTTYKRQLFESLRDKVQTMDSDTQKKMYFDLLQKLIEKQSNL